MCYPELIDNYNCSTGSYLLSNILGEKMRKFNQLYTIVGICRRKRAKKFVKEYLQCLCHIHMALV